MLGDNFNIVLTPNRSCFRSRLLDTTHYGTYSEGIRRRGSTDQVIRHRKRRIIHLATIAIEVVLRVIIFVGLDTPRTEDTVSSLNSHQSTIQLIRILSLGMGRKECNTKCYDE